VNSLKTNLNQSDPDVRVGNVAIEVKAGVAAIRNIRSGLLRLAYDVAQAPDLNGFLVLPDASVTKSRLEKEWHLASSVIRPDILQRLHICISEEDHWIGIPDDPDTATQKLISSAVAERPRGGVRLGRPDYSFMVAELLIYKWATREGSVTTKWLMETMDCNYQTVAKGLRKLGGSVVRHSDRKIEFRELPRDEWARLVAISEKARGTVRFTDRSGQPRSWESLMKRLRGLGRKDIGIGGVPGAKHHYAALDIVGSPRLDVSLHCPDETADLSFVERLDPALTRTEARDEPVSLAVHLLRRKDPLFDTSADGVVWADKIECLFDLHEARLEPQALEFFRSFETRKGQQ
jgi:hypothetical protein